MADLPADVSAARAAVLEDPDDDGRWRVFADALTQAGDFRGEIITLELLVAAAGDAEQPRLQDQVAGLYNKHRRALTPQIILDHPALWDVTLSQGHLAAVSFMGIDLDMLASVLGSEHGPFVTELRLRPASYDFFPGVVHVLLAELRPRLRLLGFDDIGLPPAQVPFDCVLDLLETDRLPRLDTLLVAPRLDEEAATALPRLVSAPSLPRLRGLGLAVDEPLQIAAHFDDLQHLEELRIYGDADAGLAQALRAGMPGTRVVLPRFTARPCPRCRDSNTFELMEILEEGEPPGAPGHEIVYQNITLYFCADCRTPFFYELDHDCFEYEDEWDIVYTYLVDTGDADPLMGFIDGCPDPRQPACGCAAHGFLREQIGALRMAAIPTGRHNHTIEIDHQALTLSLRAAG